MDDSTVHVPPRIYRRVPFNTAVRLRFDRFRGFIEEYSANLSLGGMFIRTDSPAPVGTELPIEFHLGEDYELIRGVGRVVWVREEEQDEDNPPGMGIRFLELTPGSRELIFKMVERRVREGGKPFDVDAAAADLMPRPPDPGPAPEGPVRPPAPPAKSGGGEAPRGGAPAADPASAASAAPASPWRPEGDGGAAAAWVPAAEDPAPAAPPRPDEAAVQAARPPQDEPLADAPPGNMAPSAEPAPVEPPVLAPVEPEAPALQPPASAAPSPPVHDAAPIAPEPQAADPEPPATGAALSDFSDFLSAAEEAQAAPTAAADEPADLDVPASPQPWERPDPGDWTDPGLRPESGTAYSSEVVERSPSWRRVAWIAVPAVLVLAVAAYVVQDRFLADEPLDLGPTAAWTQELQEDELMPLEAGGEAASEAAPQTAAGADPEPVSPAAADPAAADTAELAATSDDPARHVENITWSSHAGGTTFLVWADGQLSADRIVDFRIGGANPRHVVRILGIERPYGAGRLDVDSGEVRQVRTGLHSDRRPSELHLVFDLAADDVEVRGIEVTGSRLRIEVEAAGTAARRLRSGR